MHAVVIQHEEHEGLELLEPALHEAGFSFTRRFRGVEHRDLEAHLVVVLGGSMGVHEADQHPFLRQELAFLAERVALERPVLGVCLGAQLLASAAGADVFPGKNGFEVGVGPVRLTQQAQEDPVFGGLPQKLTVAHWHGDTHTPVPGATLLASSDRYTQQAFRLGPSYGLQFHLELSGDTFERWVRAAPDFLRERRADPQSLAGQRGKLDGAQPTLALARQRLASHFARMHKVT